MNKAFEQISLIEGMIAAAFVSAEGKLEGWCANSAISPDKLLFIGETCQVVLSANRGEQRPAQMGAVAFGNRTLIFREGPSGLFLVYLDSPVDEAVLAWLWERVNPLFAAEGIKLE